MNKCLLGLIPVFALGFLGCTDGGSESVVMGFTPSENAATVATNGAIVADLITKKTGVKFKTYVASDYTALIEAMRGGRVQFAWLAPFQLVLAEKHAGAKVLLKVIRDKKAYFYSVIFVKNNSPFKKIQDLRGKNIAWVDPASSSGYIVPKASLINDGINPDKFFGKQIFAGGHDSAVLGVMNGSVDAGATFSNDPEGKTASWTMLHTFHSGDRDKVRVIYYSKPIPNDTFATTDKYFSEHQDIVKKVTDAVLNLDKNPDGKKALDELYKIDSMEPSKPEEFESLRKAAALLDVDVKKKK